LEKTLRISIPGSLYTKRPVRWQSQRKIKIQFNFATIFFIFFQWISSGSRNKKILEKLNKRREIRNISLPLVVAVKRILFAIFMTFFFAVG
jgi:hypothetical protein